MKINMRQFDSIPELLDAIMQELDKAAKKPKITVCYCEHCGAPLEDDNIENKLLKIGKAYLDEGMPSVPINLGNLFRLYLKSNIRRRSFETSDCPIPVEERLAKVYDSDIANFLEEVKDLIDKEEYIIE